MGFIREIIEGKEQQIIGNSDHALSILEEEWNQFIVTDTYLIYNSKEQWLDLVKQSKKILKVPWYLFWHVKLKNRIKQNIEKIHNFENKIVDYNTDFIERKKKEYAFLFKKNNLVLDDNQQTAIITDDKHNLVVAGAGSGKTEVLTTRIAYLIKRNSDTIKPERILALAFQNKAANEIQQRLKQRYDIDVEIRTFHSLGKKLINDEAKTNGIDTPRLKLECAEDWKFKHYIKKLFDNEISENKQLQNEVINFMKRYADTQIIKTNADFKEKEEFYIYQRNLQYTTIDGSKVKSEAERDIMNFFLTHKLNGNKIRILYECPAEWMNYFDEDGEEHIPKPDFYFPDFDIYFEHWAIGKNGTVPDWFSGNNPTQEYKKHMNLKKEQYELHKKSLIETSQADIENNNFSVIWRSFY